MPVINTGGIGDVDTRLMHITLLYNGAPVPAALVAWAVAPFSGPGAKAHADMLQTMAETVIPHMAASQVPVQKLSITDLQALLEVLATLGIKPPWGIEALTHRSDPAALAATYAAAAAIVRDDGPDGAMPAQ